MQSCLTDSLMLSLGAEAVRPPKQLWETTSTEYLRQRDILPSSATSARLPAKAATASA